VHRQARAVTAFPGQRALTPRMGECVRLLLAGGKVTYKG
jgi:hypothetical protein